MSNSIDQYSTKFQGFFSHVTIIVFCEISQTVLYKSFKIHRHVLWKKAFDADLQASLILDIFMETSHVVRTIDVHNLNGNIHRIRHDGSTYWK
ncbi:CGH_3_collapsed_G0015100.mRNA.1.CDS.1 [Saccharomyces cerevisiae]|nr:CGH_3_collapsed_G0015100.mRNA.1.CDS.1 [Saccharomyces cerevisiae]